MPDPVQTAADDALNRVRIDVTALEARCAQLERKAAGWAAEIPAPAAWHAVEAEATTIKSAVATDFAAIWSHKALALFDVVLVAAAFVAGHYL